MTSIREIIDNIQKELHLLRGIAQRLEPGLTLEEKILEVFNHYRAGELIDIETIFVYTGKKECRKEIYKALRRLQARNMIWKTEPMVWIRKG